MVTYIPIIFSMDPAHIMFWNVQRLNSLAKQNVVRIMVDSVKVNVVCLQEMKMGQIARRTILSMLGSEFDNNFVFLPSMGASGGVLIAWRAALGTMAASRTDSFSASIQFAPENRDAWWLTVVYGPQGNDNKIAFLQELRTIRALCAGPWLLGGDFNLIYKDEDKNNTNLDRTMMGRFRRLIDDLAIKEIPLHGRKFT
jgi:exonuclease III